MFRLGLGLWLMYLKKCCLLIPKRAEQLRVRVCARACVCKDECVRTHTCVTVCGGEGIWCSPPWLFPEIEVRVTGGHCVPQSHGRGFQ